MSTSSESTQQDEGWIQWFCGLEDHQFFCQVDRDYISDQFNLYGLSKLFQNYNEAIDMILDEESPNQGDHDNPTFMSIYQEAVDLFGLIHARYILTSKGLQAMKEKYQQDSFGRCPRVLCNGQLVLPVGMTDQLRKSRVKVFCPQCQDVYNAKKKCKDIDGAYFGPSFPHLFLQTFPDMNPKHKKVHYAPRIAGFKIFKKPGSKYQEREENIEYQTYSIRREKCSSDAKIF